MTLARRTPLERGPGPSRRTSLAALAKVKREGACRVCGRRDEDLVTAGQRVEAAHTIGRVHDRPRPVPEVEGDPLGPLWVDPLDVVPLCSADHRLYDARRLDLLPHMTLAEQARAVGHVGIVAALRRLTGTRPED